MAGGAVLGILTDFRFLSTGKNRYSFSEVRVGLTVPPGLLKLIESVVGPQNIIRTAMLASAFKPEEAKAVGLADELFPRDKLLANVEKFMKRLFELPLANMRSVKANLRRDRLAMLENFNEDLQNMKGVLSGNIEEGLRAVLERRRPRFDNP